MKKKKISLETIDERITILNHKIHLLKDLMRLYDKYTNRHIFEVLNTCWFIGYWVVGMISLVLGSYFIAFASFIIGFTIFMLGRKL